MWYPPKRRTEQLDAKLSALENAPADCDERPEDFLLRASACIHHLSVNNIVPPSYLRDWIWIGSHFRINLGFDNRVRELTRRALLFLFDCMDSGADKDVGFCQDIIWVTDSTVSELARHLDSNEYDSFLSPDEIKEVDDRLRELRRDVAELSADEEAALERYIALFKEVSSEIYLPGIADMVAGLYERAARNGDDRPTALACLRYIIERNDVVADTLGYLGLVDDIHAVEKTYREIENRTTWSPLIGRFNFKWPYLARVAFDETAETTRLSPFMQAVFGMAQHGLNQKGGKTCLILPETRICGAISAFLACIESIRSQANVETNDFEPAEGEDILLGDADVLIRARYAGVLEHEGTKYSSIELKAGGKTTIPQEILFLARKPAKPHRSLSSADEFNEWRKGYSPSPLTHLIGHDFRFADLIPEVLLVTPRNRLDELLPRIKPMGSTIPELIGVKYIASTGTETNHSGTQLADPLIWSCSDAGTARELIASSEGGITPRYVIVDSSDLATELEYLVQPGEMPDDASRLVFSCLHDTEAVRELENQGYKSWLLRQSDMDFVPQPILPPPERKPDTVTQFRLRQELSAHMTSEIHDVRCDPVERLYEHLRDLRGKFRDVADTLVSPH